MYQKSAVVVLIAFVIIAFIVIATKGETVPEATVGEMNTPTEEQAPSTEEMETEDSTGAGMPTGKIDVRVACQSALMYTTFTDGAAADAYVEECVEGKHPEVIERYINDLGVDGAVI